jgi:hypothetical protein
VITRTVVVRLLLYESDLMSADADSHHELVHEPLLLPVLIEQYRGNRAGDGTILQIMRGLLSSPMTDAERAGERLRVFGWQLDGPESTMRWVYRIVGEESGKQHLQFTLAVPHAASDIPCRLLGLQLQITLNGVDATPADELDAYMELAAAARRGE